MSNAELQSPLKASIPAGEHLVKGQLVSIGDDGRGYFALPPDHPEAKFHPIFQKETVSVTNEEMGKYIVAVNAADGSKHSSLASLRMVSGTILVAFAAQSNIMLAAFTEEGVLLNKHVLGTSDNLHVDVAMTQLNDGTVAVAFASGVPSVLSVATVNEMGELFGPTSTLDNMQDPVSISVAPLPGINFVVAFAVGEFRSPAFAIFNNMGHVEVSPQTIEVLTEETKITNNQSVSVVGLDHLGFAVAYGRGETGAGVVRLEMFNERGQRTGTSLQVGGRLEISASGPFVKTAKLKGGQFAVGSYGSVEPGFQVQVFDPVGTPQGPCQVLDRCGNFDTANHLAMAGLANGNLAVVWSEAGLGAGAVISPAGSFVMRRANYNECTGSITLAPLATGGAVVALQASDGLRVGIVDNKLYGDVSATRIDAGTKDAALIAHGLNSTHDGNIKMVAVGSVGAMVQLGMFGSYRLPARTPLGVMDSDAAENEPAMLQLTGTVELKDAFKFPFVINTRENPIPGQKMAVVGKLAILHGIA